MGGRPFNGTYEYCTEYRVQYCDFAAVAYDFTFAQTRRWKRLFSLSRFSFIPAVLP